MNHMSVKGVMVEEVITVKPSTTVREAVALMNENEIGCLIVTKKGKPVGIITERDILKKIICQSKNPERVRFLKLCLRPS